MIYQTRSMRITERAGIDTRIITRGYLDAIGGIPADLYDKENSHRILEITRGFFRMDDETGRFERIVDHTKKKFEEQLKTVCIPV